MERQLDHHELNFTQKKHPLYLILDGVTDPRNVGSFFRLADAMGVSKLLLCGNTPSPPNRLIRKISRQTDSVVEHQCCATVVEAIGQLENIDLVALEITSTSVSLNDSIFTPNKPVAIIVGAEDVGVSDVALALVHRSIHIPMLGQNSSMNVVIASAMIIQEVVRQFEYEKQ